MKIHIDEGGHFTANAGVSVLCALSLPTALTRSAVERILAASERWPRKDGELKGGLLNKAQLTALVTILYNHEALLHCNAVDVMSEDQAAIEDHKTKQCEGLTKYLLPTHPKELATQVQRLRTTLEKMPNQLYVQFGLLSDLVITAAQDSAFYFSQRRPEELAQFDWVIDAKDPKRVSIQEAWWRDTLGPLGESKSRVNPFARIDDANFDYSHFDMSYRVKKELWFSDGPRETVDGVDIAKLVTKSVVFEDSRKNVLLQAVDVLANFMRRTLNDEVRDDDVTHQLGRLQIMCNKEGIKQPFDFLSFSSSPQPRKGHGRIARIMNGAARPMILRGFASEP